MRQIAVGDRLWRSVFFSGGGDVVGHRVDDTPFVRGERGGWVFRTGFGDQFCKGWRVYPQTEPRMRGLVVIVKGAVPDDWIHLRVVGISRSGKLAFAKAVTGTEAELVSAYVNPGCKDWSEQLDLAHASGEWI
jgi:hypothetical protein